MIEHDGQLRINSFKPKSWNFGKIELGWNGADDETAFSGDNTDFFKW